MWIESVKRRVQARNLDAVASQLDAAGMMKELYIMIRKARPIVSVPYQNEFLDIIRILTEEVWKESKRSSSINTDEQPKPETLSSEKTYEKLSLNSTKLIQGKPQTPLNLTSPLFTKKYNFTTTPLNRSGSESFFSTPKYKNQVSKDVAYMSTFSFPKGCATFSRTRRVTTNRIPDIPGPGSYFCDPRTAQVSICSSLKTPVPTCRSVKSLSLSVLKL